MPSPQNMAVKVGDGFARVWPVVDYEAVAPFLQSELFRHFGGFEQEMAKNLMVGRLRFGDP